ncbi:hypothetical protein [Streptomyces glaucus]|uniref:Uncharacterized protein n=1 Tax=Streptomyces glaucus TaxID=284029 RepID=A0ABN3KIS5_9ACTN
MVRARPDGEKAQADDPPGLSTREDPELGAIVVGRNGMTVHRFLQDEAWPEPVPACAGACPEKWPTVAPAGTDDTEGVEKISPACATRRARPMGRPSPPPARRGAARVAHGTCRRQ